MLHENARRKWNRAGTCVIMTRVFQEGFGGNKITFDALSEQLAHSAVDLHLKEIIEFLYGSEMNKNPTLM